MRERRRYAVRLIHENHMAVDECCFGRYRAAAVNGPRGRRGDLLVFVESLLALVYYALVSQGHGWIDDLRWLPGRTVRTGDAENISGCRNAANHGNDQSVSECTDFHGDS